MASTANGDNAAQQAQDGRRSRREAAAAQFLHSGGRSIDKGLKVKHVGEGLPGYSQYDYADEDGQRQEPYLKVDTPNEYPQSSWGHVGRRPYGGVIKG